MFSIILVFHCASYGLRLTLGQTLMQHLPSTVNASCRLNRYQQILNCLRLIAFVRHTNDVMSMVEFHDYSQRWRLLHLIRYRYRWQTLSNLYKNIVMNNYVYDKTRLYRILLLFSFNLVVVLVAVMVLNIIAPNGVRVSFGYYGQINPHNQQE